MNNNEDSNKNYLSDHLAKIFSAIEREIALIEGDTAQYRKERLEKFFLELRTKPTKVTEKTPETNKPKTVDEITFNLNYLLQEGKILGKYETANKKDNPIDKWKHAYNVLKDADATIRNRYQGHDYVFCYWLFGSENIFRQHISSKET